MVNPVEKIERLAKNLGKADPRSLWYIVPHKNGFIIRNKDTGQAMCPGGSDQICVKSCNLENCFAWQFYNEQTNSEIAYKSSTDLDKKSVLLKDTNSSKWLKVLCGNKYESNDGLVTHSDRENAFNQKFTIDFEDKDHFTMSTSDNNGRRMYVTSRSENALITPLVGVELHRLVCGEFQEKIAIDLINNNCTKRSWIILEDCQVNNDLMKTISN